MAAVAWPWPLCSPSEAGLASVPLDNLRVVLNRRVADSRDAGSLCAILRSNCLPFIHRAGHAELPQKETLQPDIALDTIFRLYSMTKPLIAAVFLTLVDEGLVSLDDPLSKYLPCFATPVVQRHPPPPCCSRHQAARLRKAVDDACAAPVLIEDVDPLQLPYLVAIAGPRCVAVSSENLSGAHCRVKLVPGAACVPAACDAAVRPITLRMLLTHTSGIGYGPGIEYQSPSTEVHRRYDDLCRATERGDVANLADWVVRLAEIPLLHQPGERFLYSYSLDVLGRVVEVVADGKLQEIAETRIFKPLGMVDTSFDVAPEALHRLAALYKHRRTGKDNLDKRHGARAGVPTLDLVDPRGKVSGWAAGSASHVVSAGGGVELVRGGAVGTLVDYLKFCAMLLAGGVAVGGRRILSQSLIEVALQDHLAKVTSGRCLESKPGVGFGLLGAVNLTKKPVGQVSWGGFAATRFAINTHTGCAYVFLGSSFCSGAPSKDIDDAILAALASEDTGNSLTSKAPGTTGYPEGRLHSQIGSREGKPVRRWGRGGRSVSSTSSTDAGVGAACPPLRCAGSRSNDVGNDSR
eukprot:gnl/TRDRNA2_/TRDRNA2_171844_c3_seq3.p1 gnl/TRDRNA2_/TRDRNA2_171844_c3~~gnl/TRDRNA2_/TRDRNA2_171844_c3_seq3.p1  ORF type:complete len:599 (-),score=57.23 gnl/TRDRNA2_/TRDRNA2_171844_c3_seq3:190-1923(-)